VYTHTHIHRKGGGEKRSERENNTLGYESVFMGKGRRRNPVGEENITFFKAFHVTFLYSF